MGKLGGLLTGVKTIFSIGSAFGLIGSKNEQPKIPVPDPIPIAAPAPVPETKKTPEDLQTEQLNKNRSLQRRRSLTNFFTSTSSTGNSTKLLGE